MTLLYALYRLGYLIAMALPLKASYAIACSVADAHALFSKADKRALRSNFRIVFGESVSDKRIREITRGVSRNFAKYLVDFFRFSKMDEGFVRKSVKINGKENIDNALAKDKGVIILSAHLGNWELGALVVAALGYPLAAVVLSHEDKRVNDFFVSQRRGARIHPIDLGMSLKSCFIFLKQNKLLALLGDRDFTGNGVYTEFFGKKTMMPKGPAALSHRLGSAIVPSFLIREKDDTFTLYIDKPIYPDGGSDEETAIKDLQGKYLSVMESFIKRYPEQWCAFREIWDDNGTKNLRPDTVL